MKPFHRNVLLWIFPLFLFTTAGIQAENAPAAASNQYKRYSIKSAIIEYALTGVQTGTETVYFDDYGKREARYTQATMNMMGKQMASNRLTLLDEDWIYAIDLDKKSGAKIKNPMFDTLRDSAPDGDYTQVGIEMMKKMGGVKTGAEEVAGKTCDSWDIKDMGTKSCIWNTIPLKTEAKMGDMEMSSTATKIEEGASIPQEKFQIPADVKIMSGPEMAQMMESLQKEAEGQPKS